MPNNNLPIEVGVEKAKDEILQAVNLIGEKYKLPTLLLMMIVSNIASEAKINTYETIISTYDMSLPENLKKQHIASQNANKKVPPTSMPSPPSSGDGVKK